MRRTDISATALLLMSILLATVARAEGVDVSRAAEGKAQAAVSGELHVPGLRSTVHVLRDRWGVAHIYADNVHDLFFAQGVVASQDRLFQMELDRKSTRLNSS